MWLRGLILFIYLQNVFSLSHSSWDCSGEERTPAVFLSFLQKSIFGPKHLLHFSFYRERIFINPAEKKTTSSFWKSFATNEDLLSPSKNIYEHSLTSLMSTLFEFFSWPKKRKNLFIATTWAFIDHGVRFALRRGGSLCPSGGCAATDLGASTRNGETWKGRSKRWKEDLRCQFFILLRNKEHFLPFALYVKMWLSEILGFLRRTSYWTVSFRVLKAKMFPKVQKTTETRRSVTELVEAASENELGVDFSLFFSEVLCFFLFLLVFLFGFFKKPGGGKTHRNNLRRIRTRFAGRGWWAMSAPGDQLEEGRRKLVGNGETYEKRWWRALFFGQKHDKQNWKEKVFWKPCRVRRNPLEEATSADETDEHHWACWTSVQ